MGEDEVMSESPPHLLFERRGHVAVVTLNRPEVKNALSMEMMARMADAWVEIDEDPDIRAAVVTGAGGSFCAGMDLKAFATSGPPQGLGDFFQHGARKPLIAAVEGFAVAGGLEIALACDLIVAARGTRLGVPEVKRSLVAAAGALLRLPRRLPYGVAMELALTGDPIDAERAHELGLVNRLAEPGGALGGALELARAIAVNGPLALRATKEVLERQWDWGEQDFWARQAEITGPVFASDDAREGAIAFAEKRPPVWRGR